MGFVCMYVCVCVCVCVSVRATFCTRGIDKVIRSRTNKGSESHNHSLESGNSDSDSDFLITRPYPLSCVCIASRFQSWTGVRRSACQSACTGLLMPRRWLEQALVMIVLGEDLGEF